VVKKSGDNSNLLNNCVSSNTSSLSDRRQYVTDHWLASWQFA